MESRLLPFGSSEVEFPRETALDSARTERSVTTSGRLAGIARHARPRGPMETLGRVAVNRIEGIHGDFRGAARPGKVPKRQISLMEAENWAEAMAELGLGGNHFVPWYERRANLLVQGLRLPHEAGTVIAIGASLRIEMTCECNPCSRMEEIASGLKAVLLPDWRGGILGKVITDGEIAVGDEVRIET